MHRNQIEKNWNRMKAAIQEKWNKLTNDDLREINGNFDHMIQKIQNRYGCSREHAEREIQNWMPTERKEMSGMEHNWNEHQMGQRGNEGSCGPSCSSNKKKKHDDIRNTENDSEWKKKRKAG